MTDDELIAEARRLYADPSDNRIEIDDNASVGANVDGGRWVAAWVWVPGDDEALDSLNAEMEGSS